MKPRIPQINLKRVESLIAYNFKHQRPYASFFDWQNSDNPDLAKKVKERSIVCELVKSLEHDCGKILFKVVRYGDDPPDSVGIQPDGVEVGFEVTELVSREAIAANRKDPKSRYYKLWEEQEVLAWLEKTIERKSAQLSRSPYSKNILVVHTDEPEIRWCMHEYEVALKSHTFQKPVNLDAAYILFSYRPGRETYPYLQLNLR